MQSHKSQMFALVWWLVYNFHAVSYYLKFKLRCRFSVHVARKKEAVKTVLHLLQHVLAYS